MMGGRLESRRYQRLSQYPATDGGVWGGPGQQAAAHVLLEGATLESLQDNPEQQCDHSGRCPCAHLGEQVERSVEVRVDPS